MRSIIEIIAASALMLMEAELALMMKDQMDTILGAIIINKVPHELTDDDPIDPKKLGKIVEEWLSELDGDEGKAESTPRPDGMV